jgi:hypothetical protein
VLGDDDCHSQSRVLTYAAFVFINVQKAAGQDSIITGSPFLCAI